MDFLIYGRGALAGDVSDTPQLDEEHWSYMDTYADRMTARGPTLSVDRQTWTGSLHVLALPHAQAAQAFAWNDPYHRADMFTDHLIRRFDNQLPRTMWDFTLGSGDLPFFVLADSAEDHPPPAGPATYSPSLGLSERLIVWGTLSSTAEQLPSGVALAIAAPDQDTVRSVIADEPAILGGCAQFEIHSWEFGGRR
jgi:uncharacterized protein